MKKIVRREKMIMQSIIIRSEWSGFGVLRVPLRVYVLQCECARWRAEEKEQEQEEEEESNGCGGDEDDDDDDVGCSRCLVVDIVYGPRPRDCCKEATLVKRKKKSYCNVIIGRVCFKVCVSAVVYIYTWWYSFLKKILKEVNLKVRCNVSVHPDI